MIKNICIAAVALAALSATSACSVTSGDGGGVGGGLAVASNIVTLQQDGSIPDQNFANTGTRGSFSDLRTVNGRLSGFAYQYGRVAGTNRFLGVAGIAPSSDAGAAPNKATASYSGDYAFTYVDSGRVENEDGKISLDADFAAGTLEGGADGLEIEGTINGQTVGGSATYRDVEADLTGIIGTERAVAAFAGNRGSALLVGGIIADADPDD